MENNKQSIKKLSLGNTFSCLNHALWQQKKMNSAIYNENRILKTKVRFIKDSINKPQQQSCIKQKIHLKKLYELIRQQKEWLNKTCHTIEQKNYQQQLKQKTKIQVKLLKTNKKVKQLTKKVSYLQKKVQAQLNFMKNRQILLKTDEKQINNLSQDAVFQELERQNLQLQQLLKYKQHKMKQDTRFLNEMKQEVIELLQIKNKLKKSSLQSKGTTKNRMFNQRTNTFHKTQTKNPVPYNLILINPFKKPQQVLKTRLKLT